MNTLSLQIQFGQRKGKILQYPALPGLRPTLARSRDVLFNWIQKMPEFVCLDAFAGTGILGVQALCLGAKHVDFIEPQPLLIGAMEKHLKQMGLSSQANLYPSSAKDALKKLSSRYNMIFLDPPFENVALAQILWDELVLRDLVSKECLIYLEIPKDSTCPLSHTTQLKHKQIGDVWIYLLQYT